jgi:mannose-6-phosphate isomerase-like protein (cupin superfamily)
MAMTGDRRPSWSPLTAAGLFRVAAVGGKFDRHYHDCDEYWLIFGGRARVTSEGVEYLVGPGDIVCTEAGNEHDVLAVEGELLAFYLEDRLLPGGRTGHLHRTAEDALGHEVRPL